MQFHQTVLDNGLQVIAELNGLAHSVACGFFVKAGSRDETPEVAGVSHFLEHMVFKGTPRRDALAVNRDFDRVGARHNAQTSEEDTFYHVTCLPEYLPAAFDVLSDILRPSLREEDFVTEKDVILEEIHRAQDNPMSVAYDAAKELHFGTHPLGKSVLGTLGSVGGMTLDSMRAYFARQYSPSNIVVALAGNTDWDRCVGLARDHCGGWTGGTAGRVAVPPKGTGAFRTLLREEDQQMTLLAVCDAPPLESDDRYAAHLLATVLGHHSGSRLYWALVDPGHADSFGLWYQSYNQAGAFFTFVSCDPDNAQANLERVAEVYRDTLRSGVTDDELTQAKNKVLSVSVLTSERPMGRLDSLGFHWTYRREYLSAAAELEAYSRVTTADVRRVLERWPLLPLTTVSVGPTTELTPVG